VVQSDNATEPCVDLPLAAEGVRKVVRPERVLGVPVALPAVAAGDAADVGGACARVARRILRCRSLSLNSDSP
jgi:hypothetical protein